MRRHCRIAPDRNHTGTLRDFIPFDYDNYNSFICVCQWFRDKFRFPYICTKKSGDCVYLSMM